MRSNNSKVDVKEEGEASGDTSRTLGKDVVENERDSRGGRVRQ